VCALLHVAQLIGLLLGLYIVRLLFHYKINPQLRYYIIIGLNKFLKIHEICSLLNNFLTKLNRMSFSYCQPYPSPQITKKVFFFGLTEIGTLILSHRSGVWSIANINYIAFRIIFRNLKLGGYDT